MPGHAQEWQYGRHRHAPEQIERATLTNASVRLHLFKTTPATFLQTLRPPMPA
jgi:hypothetical protein